MTILDHPAALGNFRRGRRGRIALLVLHTMEGTLEGTAKWFANPEAVVSAHYGLSKEGLVYRFVLDEDTARHAGNADVNACSIGIELEGRADDPANFTPHMMASLTTLCADLCHRYGIPPDRKHVMGHCDVPDPRDPTQLGGLNHHTDPGSHFDFEGFLNRLKIEVDRRMPNV